MANQELTCSEDESCSPEDVEVDAWHTRREMRLGMEIPRTRYEWPPWTK